MNTIAHLGRGTPTLSSSAKKTSLSKNLDIAVIVFLCCCHLLLPLERGFSNFDVAGHPVPVAVVISLIGFCLTWISSNGRVWRYFSGTYVVAQCFCSGFFLMSAVMSDTPLIATVITIKYFTIWVLNYVTIMYLWKNGSRQMLINTLCVVGLMAAIVGIVEGVFVVRLPIYQAWISDYYGVGSRLEKFAQFDRVTGTLGHPHIYSTAMLLLLPFVGELRSRPLRIVITIALVAAALLTVSRSVLLMLAVLSIGFAVVQRRKIMLWFAVLTIIVGIGIATLGSNSLTQDPRAQLWLVRVGLVQTAETRYAEQNVSGRSEMLDLVYQSTVEASPFTLLFGHGMRSGEDISETLNLNTLDNTYATLLYEGGLLELLIFLYIFAEVLYRNRVRAHDSLHWYNVISLLAVGVTFVFYSYSTFNFIIVASIVLLQAGRPQEEKPLIIG